MVHCGPLPPFLCRFLASGEQKGRSTGSGKLKVDKTFRLPEKNHVSPSWTLSMDSHGWQALSEFEQADGRLLGTLEPGHDRGAVVFADRHRLGLDAGFEEEILHVA